MSTFSATLVLGLTMAFAGCATQAATTLSLPPERASECRANCQTLGMKLSAVVIIMNSAGCVCEPASSTASVTAPGGASVAGGAAIAVAAQVAQQQSNRTSAGAAH